MKTLKYSRQRESVKELLASRKDHPTADTIYEEMRETFPHISLGTVYRNLSLLESLGEVVRITTGSGADRYDGNIQPHHHFICQNCSSVIDLEMENIDHILKIAAQQFDGTIDGYITHFFGTCEKCINLNKESSI